MWKYDHIFENNWSHKWPCFAISEIEKLEIPAGEVPRLEEHNQIPIKPVILQALEKEYLVHITYQSCLDSSFQERK